MSYSSEEQFKRFVETAENLGVVGDVVQKALMDLSNPLRGKTSQPFRKPQVPRGEC
jgi:hypothetical protein